MIPKIVKPGEDIYCVGAYRSDRGNCGRIIGKCKMCLHYKRLQELFALGALSLTDRWIKPAYDKREKRCANYLAPKRKKRYVR